VDDACAREQLFMALWCLKEAVVKANGTGINAPPGLKGFSVGEVYRQFGAFGWSVHTEMS
jgi:phosphopantetheinyl transferase